MRRWRRLVVVVCWGFRTRFGYLRPLGRRLEQWLVIISVSLNALIWLLSEEHNFFVFLLNRCIFMIYFHHCYIVALLLGHSVSVINCWCLWHTVHCLIGVTLRWHSMASDVKTVVIVVSAERPSNFFSKLYKIFMLAPLCNYVVLATNQNNVMQIEMKRNYFLES